MIDFLLRAYPRAWRERYGGELRQLVDDVGLTPPIAADVVWSGMVERGRSARQTLIGGPGMVIGPAWRHPTGWAVFGLLFLVPTLLFVTGSLLAYQLGLAALRPALESANQWLQTTRIVDLALVIAPAITLLFAVVPLIRFEVRQGSADREVVIGVRLRLANLVVGGVALVLGALLAWHIIFESVMQVGA